MFFNKNVVKYKGSKRTIKHEIKIKNNRAMIVEDKQDKDNHNTVEKEIAGINFYPIKNEKNKIKLDKLYVSEDNREDGCAVDLICFVLSQYKVLEEVKLKANPDAPNLELIRKKEKGERPNYLDKSELIEFYMKFTYGKKSKKTITIY